MLSSQIAQIALTSSTAIMSTKSALNDFPSSMGSSPGLPAIYFPPATEKTFRLELVFLKLLAKVTLDCDAYHENENADPGNLELAPHPVRLGDADIQREQHIDTADCLESFRQEEHSDVGLRC
jgi:hypothetical protein